MNILSLIFPNISRLLLNSNTKEKIKLLAVKVGLATAAVYYVKEQGVWSNSNESTKAYEKLKKNVAPYVEEVKAQIPIELPVLPQTDNAVSLARQYWNVGVLATFKYISQLPQTVKTWTNKGFEKALENQELKNFFDSFSSNKAMEQKPVEEKKK